MSNDNLPPDGRYLHHSGDGQQYQSEVILRTPYYLGGTRGDVNKSHDDDLVDLGELWHLVMAYKWWLLSAALAGLLAALLFSFVRTPIYQATTTLQVDRRAASVVKFNQDFDNSLDLDERTGIGTQLSLLNSRTVAERVIDELHLDRVGLRNRRQSQGMFGWFKKLLNLDQSADPEPKTSADDGRLSAWRMWINRIKENRSKLKTPSVSDEGRLNHASLISALGRTIHAEQIRDSRMIKVSVENPDPELAARIANSVAEIYISLNLERRLEASSYAKNFLTEQLALTKTKLEDSEKNLNEYARRNDILTLDNNINPANQTFAEYSSALVRAEQERIKFEAEYQSIRNAPNTAAQVLSSQTIQAYKTQRSVLDAEYQQNSKIYKDSYPLMIQLRAQIQDLNVKIQNEINNILRSVNNQLVAARQQENDIRSQLKNAEKEITSKRDSEVGYNLLRREVDTNRELYDGLLQQVKEVGVSGGVETNNIQVVDKAQIPLFPYKPKLKLNVAIGLLGGFIFGFVLVFLREALDDSIKSIEDLERNFHLPMLGMIPSTKSKNTANFLAFLTYKDPRGHFAEAYRSLRTSLQFSGRSGAPGSLLVTSTTNGEGKSTTAVALAINFAQLGGKVALIDADMRNPMVHQFFGIDNTTGLSSYLLGQSSKGTLITSKSAEVGNLTVITAGPPPSNPVELLSGSRFAGLLNALQEGGYEHIIVDGPPVLGLADAIVLGSQMKVLYVVQAHATRIGHIKAALQRLRMSGIVPLGIVLTKTTARNASYYAEERYYGHGALALPIDPKVGSSVLPSI